MRLKRTVEVSLYGVDSGSATESFTEHAIATLRATAARMESYRRQGFKLVAVRRRNPLEFVMENPGPRALRRELDRKLSQSIGDRSWDFYLRPKVRQALITAGIETLRELVQRTEEDLLYGERKVKGLGFQSISHIRSRLDREGLRLGMELPEPLKKRKRNPADLDS